MQYDLVFDHIANTCYNNSNKGMVVPESWRQICERIRFDGLIHFNDKTREARLTGTGQDEYWGCRFN